MFAKYLMRLWVKFTHRFSFSEEKKLQYLPGNLGCKWVNDPSIHACVDDSGRFPWRPAPGFCLRPEAEITRPGPFILAQAVAASFWA